MGGGAPIVKHLSGTLIANFLALSPATCTSANFAIAGATDRDTVGLGVPNALVIAGTSGGAVLDFFAWVSSSNTVTVRECNIGSGKQKSTASGIIRADVWKH